MKPPQLVGQGVTLEPGDVIEWNTEPSGRRGVVLNGALVLLPS